MSRQNSDDIEIQLMPDSWMSLNNGKNAIYDLWESFMDFCVTYPIAALACYAFTGKASNVYGLYLLLPSLLYLAAARNIIKNSYIYLLCQIPLFILAYYLSGSADIGGIVFPYLIIAGTASTKKKFRTRSAYRSFTSLRLCEMLLFFEYITAAEARYTFIEWIILYHAIIYSLSMLIYLHVSRTEKLIEWETDLSKKDLHGIKSSSCKIIALLSIPFILAFAAALYGEFEGYTESFILYLISSLFLKTNPGPQHADVKSKVPILEDVSEELNRSNAVKDSGSFKLVGIIGKYLIYFLLFLAAAVFLKAAFDIICSYFSGKNEIHTDSKESLFVKDEMYGSLAGMLNALKNKIEFSFGNSPSLRIRKMYMNLVEHVAGRCKVIQKSSTPRMIERNVRKTTGVDISLASAIYEKARYGKGGCTEEDVKKIKSFSDQLKN